MISEVERLGGVAKGEYLTKEFHINFDISGMNYDVVMKDLP